MLWLVTSTLRLSLKMMNGFKRNSFSKYKWEDKPLFKRQVTVQQQVQPLLVVIICMTGGMVTRLFLIEDGSAWQSFLIKAITVLIRISVSHILWPSTKCMSGQLLGIWNLAMEKIKASEAELHEEKRLVFKHLGFVKKTEKKWI